MNNNNVSSERAKEMVDHLKRAGLNSGFLIIGTTVVLRCPGSPYVDTPTVYEESDLANAVDSGLLRKQKITGSFEWEYYIVK